MKKLAVATFALAMAASVALAGALNQFKAGDISFSLLEKDGATPMQSASLKVLDSASGDVVAETVSDDLGKAVLALDAGRYILNVSDVNLAVFDVDAAEGISLCRVIMPDTALLVGGQEAETDNETEEGAAGASIATWIWPAAGATVAIAVLAALIIDNNTDGHGHHHDADVSTGTQTPTVYKSGNKGGSKSASAI